MTNFNKTSGFITLTVVLIIVLLITGLTLMTGKMLMSEQRTASNQVRYHEATNAAQMGIDKAVAQLMASFANRSAISSAEAPYYKVSFGDVSEITIGSTTLKSMVITSEGTSGYSADSESPDDAESKVTINQTVVSVSPISSTPAAPLTVAAGMAAGGNFSVAANPNGGGPGVPVSIWSSGIVNIGSSSSTCGQQEYYDGTCSSLAYSSNAEGKNADVVDQDTDNFPGDLLAYIFNGSSTYTEVIEDVKASYATDPALSALHIGADGLGLDNCDALDTSSSGIYVVTGNCRVDDVGTLAAPVILLVVNGNFTMNANSDVYGVVFAYTDATDKDNAPYDISINGTATLHGALVANYKLGNSNGSYNAVYDAEALANLPTTVRSITATVPGSWQDWGNAE